MSWMMGDNGAARRAAELSRRQQQVANDRQLSQLNRSERDTGMSRRRPRGHRLFADSGEQNLSSNLA
jgi:hypothetical protein